jgi:hypothetical protein
LEGTQTLVVPATTAQTLGATDYPLGVVLDNTGMVRFIGALPEDAFNGDGYIAKVIVNVVKTAREKLEAVRKGTD